MQLKALSPMKGKRPSPEYRQAQAELLRMMADRMEASARNLNGLLTKFRKVQDGADELYNALSLGKMADVKEIEALVKVTLDLRKRMHTLSAFDEP